MYPKHMILDVPLLLDSRSSAELRGQAVINSKGDFSMSEFERNLIAEVYIGLGFDNDTSLTYQVV